MWSCLDQLPDSSLLNPWNLTWFYIGLTPFAIHPGEIGFAVTIIVKIIDIKISNNIVNNSETNSSKNYRKIETNFLKIYLMIFYVFKNILKVYFQNKNQQLPLITHWQKFNLTIKKYGILIKVDKIWIHSEFSFLCTVDPIIWFVQLSQL